MLQFRRVLAFSSRVHSYLLCLFSFFFILFSLSLAVAMPNTLIELIHIMLNIVSWCSVFFGMWIILASIYQLIYTKVFAFSPIILTILRSTIVLLLSSIVSILESLVSKGVSL